MKSAAIIFLISVYFLAIMGLSLKQFYCCGVLKSTTISLSHQTKASCAKGDNKTGCCDNKFLFFKVKDNHISSDHADFAFKYFVDLQIYDRSFRHISITDQQKTIAYRSHAPPLDLTIPIYLYNRVFRI